MESMNAAVCHQAERDEVQLDNGKKRHTRARELCEGLKAILERDLRLATDSDVTVILGDRAANEQRIVEFRHLRFSHPDLI